MSFILFFKNVSLQVYPSQPHFHTCHGAALNKVYSSSKQAVSAFCASLLLLFVMVLGPLRLPFFESCHSVWSHRWCINAKV